MLKLIVYTFIKYLCIYSCNKFKVYVVVQMILFFLAKRYFCTVCCKFAPINTLPSVTLDVPSRVIYNLCETNPTTPTRYHLTRDEGKDSKKTGSIL